MHHSQGHCLVCACVYGCVCLRVFVCKILQCLFTEKSVAMNIGQSVGSFDGNMG